MSGRPKNTKLKPNNRSRSLSRPSIDIQGIIKRTPSTSKKRKATTTSPTFTTPEPKKSTTNKMTTATLEDITRIMNTHTETIRSEMKSMADAINANMTTQLASINTRIDTMQSEFNEQFKVIRTDIDKCIDQLDMSDENIKRVTLLNELKLSGIAHKNDENLQEIFFSIAQLIGFDTSNPSNIPELSRTTRRANNVTTMLPLVIMRFVAKHIRNNFYGLYLAKASKQPIKTEDIKLAQGGFVRIGENLTQHNQMIFIEAMRLKRGKMLAKVHTTDGIVHVKRIATDKPTAIKTKRELDEMLAWAKANGYVPQNNTITTNSSTTANNMNNTASTNGTASNGSEQQSQHEIQNRTSSYPMEETNTI